MNLEGATDLYKEHPHPLAHQSFESRGGVMCKTLLLASDHSHPGLEVSTENKGGREGK